jgi:hypothetical protein
MNIQKQAIVDQVEESKKLGRLVKEVLKVMGISSSNYYGWRNEKLNGYQQVLHPADRVTTRSLTEEEILLVLKTKEEKPWLRHRQIQGLLQQKRSIFQLVRFMSY